MQWITNNIAIGNYFDATSRRPDCDAILCLKPNCCDGNSLDVDVLCIPLIDGPGNRKIDVLRCTRYISDVVSSGEKILVHCHAGRSRSVCIVAAFFMQYEGMSAGKALALIENRREIYLSDGMEEILKLTHPGLSCKDT